MISRSGTRTSGASSGVTQIFREAGSGPVVKIAIPSWRTDVHGKADIVEEIVRIVGVDKVPMTPFERGDAPRKPVLNPIQLRTRRAKRGLAARGMVEAVTWSFIAKPHAELFGGGQPELALANPIASDMSDMRPSLLPGLVTAVQANINRGFPDLALFEVGQVFTGDRPEDELIAAAGVSAAALFGLGAGITRLTGTRPIRSGLRQLAFGAAAAAVTYLIGAVVGTALR